MAASDYRPEPIELSANMTRDVTRGLPARAALALRALGHLRFGQLTIIAPDGQRYFARGCEPGPIAILELRNWRLFSRAFAGGTIGVAESYLDGDWESPDVTTLLELFTINREQGETIAGAANRLLNLVQRLRHWLHDNTRSGSRRNIAAHYDLGNAFYREWLDPSMTYSSALFTRETNSLEAAQREKYRALAEGAGIGPADHVLEIGCGWGGFAEYAAREIGCRVTGLTISKEQLAYARERISKAGLSDRVEFKFQDYRDETGTYDRIASIEMFEAVGERHWGTYFDTLRARLKPGGTAGLQIITINSDAYDTYRKTPDFIQRYVFPGGMLPTAEILNRLGIERGLKQIGERIFAQDYARTLAEWRTRFLASWEKIAPLGFDERFRRLWSFYLHYCEAGFRSEYIDVRQIFLKK
jgi:cyclopropane-fatty-acyl-phospholipid synthase